MGESFGEKKELHSEAHYILIVCFSAEDHIQGLVHDGKVL